MASTNRPTHRVLERAPGYGLPNLVELDPESPSHQPYLPTPHHGRYRRREHRRLVVHRDSIAASRSAVRGYRGAAVFSHSGRGDQPGHKNARSDQLGTGSVSPLLGRGLLVGAALAAVAHDVRPLMVARNTVGRTRSS